MPNRSLIDMSGQAFAYLTVKEYFGSKWGCSIWLCVCRCGAEIKVSRQELVKGTTKSCGCYRAERAVRVFTKHGMARHNKAGTTKMSAEYQAWNNAKARCYELSNNQYKNYGARGIGMAAEWISDFEAFFAHIGPIPSPDHTLDRIDNDGNYEPGNVRWATIAAQLRNKRNNRMVEYNGVPMPMVDAAQLAGLPYHVLKNRIYRGWSDENATSTPIDMRMSHAGWHRKHKGS